MSQPIRPLYDRILVKRPERESTTLGGLHIPDSAREKPTHGKVIAVGLGRMPNGKLKPLELHIGDTVHFSEHVGVELNINGQDVLMMRESDVLCVKA